MRRHYPLNLQGVEDAGLLPWTDGVPSTGVQGSYPGHSLCTDVEAEILSALGAAGLSQAGADLTQLVQAIARGIYLGGFSGSANALSAGLPNNVAIPALLRGMRFSGSTAVANTGAVTVTLTGFSQAPGTAQLLRRDGQALQGGDLPVGPDFDVRFDGANFRLLGPAPSKIRDLAAGAGLLHAGTAGGTATAITADVEPSITSYRPGHAYTLIMPAAAANGSTTLTLDGVTPSRPGKRADGTPIQENDWGAGDATLWVDNGSQLRLVSSAPTQITSITNTAIAQSAVGKTLFSTTTPGPGSWTVPDGVYWVYAVCVGAGAGGSGCQIGGTRSGAGGGAGGTAARWIAVTPGQALNYVVGAGSLGVAYQQNSANGGSSSIGSILSATGGFGTDNVGLAGGAGGLGTGGQINLYGGAGVDGNSVNPSNPAGPGGASSLGGGGRSSTQYISSVSDGHAPGSGGGGVYNTSLTNNGGNGAPGYVSFSA